ncbi:hypothetical protein GZ77_09145 [Endozoicomonas montiporae]|uniref:Phage protein n=2 Tax=Endozoicomonas montiporae TaxID=1027273 RepID=A0A081N7T3_9GAMM|nr:hypothetical protein [Endozoicomonas montiporae]AMO55631.1 hypothetical protein EZMO1_1461 [Endozoicomonas montiporae CL-33]KEQ14506.1 hypothetical protein GZ77_09145 [Endozoicomonas montiporae]
MSLTLTKVHEAIVESLQEPFAQKVETLRVHSPLVKDIKAPALLLALDHMNGGNETGDGRTAVECSFSLCAILPEKGLPADKVSIAIANFAAEVLHQIRYNHWGLGSEVSHPHNLSAQPADFKPGKAGFESWVVSWEQTVYLGEPEPDDSLLPDTVMVGIDPDIGLDNENKYEQIV